MPVATPAAHAGKTRTNQHEAGWRIAFGGDRSGTYMARVDQPEVTLTVPLPERPTKVEFNPDNAVLARVKKR